MTINCSKGEYHAAHAYKDMKKINDCKYKNKCTKLA